MEVSKYSTHFGVVGLVCSQPPVPQATLGVIQIKLLSEFFRRH